MKKFLFAIAFVLLGLVPSIKAQSGGPNLQTQMSATSATTGAGLAASGIGYHQIQWTLTGPAPSACTITIDSSPDNSTWTTGGIIAAQTCTTGGISSKVSVVANYIRINLSTFTSNGQIFISYNGWNSTSTALVNGAGSNPLGATLNVKAFPYSAVGNGKFFVDGVTNGGNNQLTSATAIFTASDVGQTVWCVKTPLSGTATVWAAGQTTVASFVNSSTITYTGTNGGVVTGQWCGLVNPADAAAILGAFNACKTTFSSTETGQQQSFQSPACNIYIPYGIYGFSNTLNNLISTGNENCVGILGDGKTKSILMSTPTFTPSATAGSGWAIWSRCAGANLRNFSIEEASVPQNYSNNATGGVVLGSSNAFLENVGVYDQCYTGASVLYGIAVTAGSLEAHSPTVIGGGCAGTSGGFLWNASVGDIYSPFFSNTSQNLEILNQITGNNGTSIRIWGGIIDEGSVTQVVNSQDVWFIGVALTGGANCLSVDATSYMWYIGGYCGTFATNTGSGPTVAAGGVLNVTGLHVRGQNAGSYCWGGAGTINDEGGNNCTLAGGATTYGNGATFVTFPLQTNATTQLGGQQVVSGTAPTFAVTGFGGSPTVAVQTGSTDAVGAATITAGTAPAASGTFTLTFSRTFGTNLPVCTFNLVNGTGSWNALAQEPIVQTPTTASVIANWADNSVALTAASTYGFNWECYGK